MPATIATFSSSDALSDFVVRCDAIVHLAGMNRGDDVELYETNIRLVKDLITVCESAGKTPHMIFASSIQINTDTPYGRSKKEGTEFFRQWSSSTGAVFTNLVLPNIFGEHGQPFYNSVVSTFCHQLANQQKPEVIQDKEMQLLHVQKVAEEILEIIKSRAAGDLRISGTPMTVTSLLAEISEYDRLYRNGIIPDIGESFGLSLFNTYRSYLFPQHYPQSPDIHEDPRGSLFEAVKGLSGGQAFVSSTKPGITRGNHFHRSKFERFLVFSGEATIRIRKLFSEEVDIFKLCGSEPQFVDIPTLHTHSISNTGESDLLTLFWANEIFDPDRPDTFSEAV